MTSITSFVQRRTVLFGECDPAGVIYTPRIADYLVEAGLAFLSNALGQPAERFIFSLGIAIPARALNIEFLKPMTWDEVIDIEVNLAHMGSHSLTFSISGRNASKAKTFTGQITLVFISADERCVIDIPEEIARVLAE